MTRTVVKGKVFKCTCLSVCTSVIIIFSVNFFRSFSFLFSFTTKIQKKTHNVDSSTILTEDTDSFIIGQRVYVGGTKPGKIAFIGETQFAPGDWAGVALDEPIGNNCVFMVKLAILRAKFKFLGKNNGSVAGIHYFQCEDKKGVFSRLTRLTRVPIVRTPEMGSNETFICSTPQNGGSRRSPGSPTDSNRSLMKSSMSLSSFFFFD